MRPLEGSEATAAESVKREMGWLGRAEGGWEGECEGVNERQVS